MSPQDTGGVSRLRQYRSLLNTVTVILAFLVLLTWLYDKAIAASPQVHFAYNKILRDLRQADAEINSEMFANRLEVTHNYDRLNQYLNKARQASLQAANVPSFLQEADRRKVLDKTVELQGMLAEKSKLVDSFKRRNSVLRNSLAYFPSAIDHVVNNDNLPDRLKSRVELYARHVLSFARDPSADRRLQVDAARQALIDNLSAQAGSAIDNLLVHGDAIVTHLPEVNRITQATKESLSSSGFEELNQLYATGYERAENRATHYRRMLYLVALILTCYLAFTFFRLDRTRQSLAIAHAEVSQRYAAQLLAEDRLRLHATAFHNSHDGILLADANGNMLDVNPAFTRITGYERDEVIGRNPRVIKSGRHDQAFYAAMWKSLLGNGNWQGEIWNKNKYGEIYPELLSIAAVRDAKGVLTNFVAVFADIRRLKEQETQLTRMAYYDALTSLPNRILLSDRLSQGLLQVTRTHTSLAVCYLDLDGFKQVNDTCGHEAGDYLLIEMAQRLKESMRGGDTVARLGGDEFVILLLGLESTTECEQAVERILHDIIQPITIKDKVFTLSASIGVALFPQDDADPDVLLRHADQSMYQAKQSGKNRYHMFDPALDQEVRSQHDQLARIEQALAEGEFELYYQPKVDLREGRMFGVEALIRWNHPEKGLVAPGEFLPLVEEHELGIRIGEWVIASALQQMEAWHRAGLETTVSVNISGHHLQSSGFVQQLRVQLENHPGMAHQIELEMLETSALEDMVNVSGVIHQCLELGVTFSLDDFGTGYSSLTYLKRLPISNIKIDQSFVREALSDPNNLVIVQGVLGLASAFRRKIIAEGMETVEQGRALMQMGCDHAQGYGIARPMPAGDVMSWVANWTPAPEWTAIRHLKWSPVDGAMLVAKFEYCHWISQFVTALQEGQPIPHHNIGDYRQSGFGLWYYGEAQNLYQRYADFDALAQPHIRSHQLGGEIDRYWRNGQQEQARERLAELIAQRDILVAALFRLELAVAQPYQKGMAGQAAIITYHI